MSENKRYYDETWGFGTIVEDHDHYMYVVFDQDPWHKHYILKV